MMNEDNTYQLLCEVPLDLDEKGLERGNEAIIGDQQIRLLLRENRIALAKGKSKPVQSAQEADTHLEYYDIPLICVVHAHPECRFRWARLVVDLSPTKDAQIKDMAPREVRGEKPIEVKTTVGVGLKFESVANILNAELHPEYTKSRTVYYPEIVSSGPGFTKGYWDFLALSNDYLHVDRELRLLVHAPMQEPVLARFLLRAKVALPGIIGLLPLSTRIGEINETYRLD